MVKLLTRASKVTPHRQPTYNISPAHKDECIQTHCSQVHTVEVLPTCRQRSGPCRVCEAPSSSPPRWCPSSNVTDPVYSLGKAAPSRRTDCFPPTFSFLGASGIASRHRWWVPASYMGCGPGLGTWGQPGHHCPALPQFYRDIGWDPCFSSVRRM